MFTVSGSSCVSTTIRRLNYLKNAVEISENYAKSVFVDRICRLEVLKEYKLLVNNLFCLFVENMVAPGVNGATMNPGRLQLQSPNSRPYLCMLYVL